MEDSNEERTLGVSWYTKEDMIRFKVRMKLSHLKNVSDCADLSGKDLLENLPTTVTKRQYYNPVQGLYNSTGFLSLFLFRSKIILQEM